MSKVKVDEKLVTPRGEPITEKIKSGDKVVDRDLTVGDILLQGLSAGFDRSQLQTSDYALVFRLSKKIASENVSEITLKSDEVVFLKKLVEKLPQNIGLSAYVAAQVLNALEPFETEKKDVAA